MGYTIAVSNQKGGVGKTTTSINLGACLAMSGVRTLIIDLDPQGNATSGLGVESGNGDAGTVYDALLNDVPAEDILRQTVVDSLWLLPSDINLTAAELELMSEDAREFRLRAVVESLKEKVDFVIIDCPPSLGLLTVNALTAADSVIIPLQTEYYALEGLKALMNTIDMIRGSFNPELDIEGVLFTMFDGRTSLSNQVVEEVRTHYRSAVFQTIIPRNIRLSEAPSHGLPVSLYDAKSKGAEAYIDLARELIGKYKEEEPVEPVEPVEPEEAEDGQESVG